MKKIRITQPMLESILRKSLKTVLSENLTSDEECAHSANLINNSKLFDIFDGEIIIYGDENVDESIIIKWKPKISKDKYGDYEYIIKIESIELHRDDLDVDIDVLNKKTEKAALDFIDNNEMKFDAIVHNYIAKKELF